jgi:hypothetical protein
MRIPSPRSCRLGDIALLVLLLAAPAVHAEVVVIAPVADATLIEDSSGALANGAGPALFAGRTSQASGSIRRGLLAFDVAGALPRGAEVTNVVLWLLLEPSNPGGATVTLHRVGQAWSEGPASADGGSGAPADAGDVTWQHTELPGQLWSSPGGDFAGAASASALASTAGPVVWASTPQLVADVQHWLETPDAAHGWILLGDESSASTAKRFASREHPDETVHPRLEVSFERRSEVCSQVGLDGSAWALCSAYCEALDCDTATTRASSRACDRLATQFGRRTGGALLPCEIPDGDADSVPDAIDNCPAAPNTDQADGDFDLVGDACDNCPGEANPGQEDTFGEPGVGDVCDCPCFTAGEVEDLLLSVSDPATYDPPTCVDTRIFQKPLTSVSVLRGDGQPCSTSGLDCSALSVEFTEDRVCQLNPPAPAVGFTVQGISDPQRSACRDAVLEAAGDQGVRCF